MLRSVIDASVRRTGVWPRLHSTRLIGGRRVLPAVTELQCHLQPANTLKNTWIQSKTSVRLGIFVHHLGAARHLHINRGIRQQSSHAAAASAVEMEDEENVLDSGDVESAAHVSEAPDEYVAQVPVRTAGLQSTSEPPRTERVVCFTLEAGKRLEKGPTEKDGEGYIYLLSELDTQNPDHWYKLGCTVRKPEVRLAELERENGTKYEIAWYRKVKYHKDMEIVAFKELKGRGMKLPTLTLPCGNTRPGGTEWVRGKDVIDVLERLVEKIDQLNMKGDRFRQ